MSNVLVELSNALAEAVEKAGASTVMVNARRRLPATGIAYSEDLILTANHVVEREEGITVILSDGTEVSATVAGRDHGTDLALLRLESPTPAQSARLWLLQRFPLVSPLGFQGVATPSRCRGRDQLL